MKKELPEDAERFAKIDVSFKALLKHFKSTPNCVASCAKDGLMKDLEGIAEELEPGTHTRIQNKVAYAYGTGTHNHQS